MIDNIFSQEKIVNRLKAEISSSKLPKVLLFAGEAFSGKLTTAFETARALTCLKEANWKCGCTNCKQQRFLSHPRTLYLGERIFLLEIAACLEFCKNSSDLYIARLMLIRSVTKLTCRFNIVVASTLESKIAKVASSLSALTELLAPLYNEEIESSWFTDEFASKVLAECKKVATAVPSSVNIDEIRALNSYLYSASSGKRVVIIEGVDKLNSSCANALLKTLEEPPKEVTFILLAKRRGSVLPTILSRSRVYSFSNRTLAQQEAVIKNIFRSNASNVTIKEYLYSLQGIQIDEFQRVAKAMLASILGNSNFASFQLSEVLNLVSDSASFVLFLEQLLKAIKSLEFQKENYAAQNLILFKWNEILKEAIYLNESFNQSPKALLESIYFRMQLKNSNSLSSL